MRLRDFDARKIRIDVSRYAPPQIRGTASGRMPARERLSRGAPDGADSNAADAAVPGTPHPAALAESIKLSPASPRMPLSMTGRLAVAVSLVAGLTVLSASYLESKAQNHAAAGIALAKASAKPVTAVAKTRPSDLPRTVHTIAFRRAAATVGEGHTSTIAERTAPLRQADAAAPRRGAIASPKTETAPALSKPLKVWAMFPDKTSGVWHGAAKPAPAGDTADVKDAKDAKDAKDVKQAKDAAPQAAAARGHARSERHVAARHVHHHHRRRVAHRR
ncbi:MAG TPA: hypothetical protein VE224_06390, partial [Pseudolabrys sp.]|nr:hypothetical protein [Pseudolabrys sp.]